MRHRFARNACGCGQTIRKTPTVARVVPRPRAQSPRPPDGHRERRIRPGSASSGCWGGAADAHVLWTQPRNSSPNRVTGATGATGTTGTTGTTGATGATGRLNLHPRRHGVPCRKLLTAPHLGPAARHTPGPGALPHPRAGTPAARRRRLPRISGHSTARAGPRPPTRDLRGAPDPPDQHHRKPPTRGSGSEHDAGTKGATPKDTRSTMGKTTSAWWTRCASASYRCCSARASLISPNWTADTCCSMTRSRCRDAAPSTSGTRSVAESPASPSFSLERALTRGVHMPWTQQPRSSRLGRGVDRVSVSIDAGNVGRGRTSRMQRADSGEGER